VLGESEATGAWEAGPRSAGRARRPLNPFAAWSSPFSRTNLECSVWPSRAGQQKTADF